MPSEHHHMLRPELRKRDSENLYSAFSRPIQTQHLPQERGLPRTGTADDAQNLAPKDRQLQVVMNHVSPESRAETSYPNDDGGRVRHRQIPTCRNATANSASATRTLLIAITTELVVPAPRLSVLGFTRSPK